VQFLRKEGLPEIWARLCRNHTGQQSRLAALHGWFDGLKTTRLIHHLTDMGWSRQTAVEALPPLFKQAGLPAVKDADMQLMLLRQRQIGTACAFCRLSETSKYCKLAQLSCQPHR